MPRLAFASQQCMLNNAHTFIAQCSRVARVRMDLQKYHCLLTTMPLKGKREERDRSVALRRPGVNDALHRVVGYLLLCD